VVTQWLKDRSQEILSTAYGQDIEAGLKRQRRFDEFGAILATAMKGRAVDLGDRNAQKRRGDVRTIVHVLVEQPIRLASAANRTHGVDVEKQASLTTI
jgi:hypothetical protein